MASCNRHFWGYDRDCTECVHADIAHEVGKKQIEAAEREAAKTRRALIDAARSRPAPASAPAPTASVDSDGCGMFVVVIVVIVFVLAAASALAALVATWIDAAWWYSSLVLVPLSVLGATACVVFGIALKKLSLQPKSPLSRVLLCSVFWISFSVPMWFIHARFDASFDDPGYFTPFVFLGLQLLSLLVGWSSARLLPKKLERISQRRRAAA